MKNLIKKILCFHYSWKFAGKDTFTDRGNYHQYQCKECGKKKYFREDKIPFNIFEDLK